MTSSLFSNLAAFKIIPPRTPYILTFGIQHIEVNNDSFTDNFAMYLDIMYTTNKRTDNATNKQIKL